VARHSPCIGICQLDEATGYCLGCGRTGSEIGDWIAMSESQRDAVWDELPERLATLSVRVRLLPWIRDELVDWIRDSIVARQGTWAIGAPGTVAEFPSADDVAIDVRVEAGVVTARRRDAAFRFSVNDRVRAFAFGDGAPIVLGLARGRAALPSVSVLQALGPDSGAIDQADRHDALIDIGIGRQYSRFCVRTGNDALVAALSGQSGRPWQVAMPIVQHQMLEAGPHCVVESAAARIEVFTSPAGSAHPYFLPAFTTAAGEEVAAELALPDYAAPVAIFYPNKA
jgi:predicted Fe-S protein YdhL (DUF1289 family)